jgi:hypothetical protein
LNKKCYVGDGKWLHLLRMPLDEMLKVRARTPGVVGFPVFWSDAADGPLYWPEPDKLFVVVDDDEENEDGTAPSIR